MANNSNQQSATLVDDGIYEIAAGYTKENKEVSISHIEVIIKGVGIDITALIEKLPLHLRNKVMHSIEEEIEELQSEFA